MKCGSCYEVLLDFRRFRRAKDIWITPDAGILEAPEFNQNVGIPPLMAQRHSQFLGALMYHHQVQMTRRLGRHLEQAPRAMLVPFLPCRLSTTEDDPKWVTVQCSSLTASKHPAPPTCYPLRSARCENRFLSRNKLP